MNSYTGTITQIRGALSNAETPEERSELDKSLKEAESNAAREQEIILRDVCVIALKAREWPLVVQLVKEDSALPAKKSKRLLDNALLIALYQSPGGLSAH